MFKGSENALVARRKYTIDFACNFELRYYPFDIQHCPMMFQLKKPTRSEAVLVLRQVKYEGGEDLLEYRVQNISSHSDFACGKC